MKQTILNALWAKIKNTFVGKNSDATLNSLNITGTGINISTTGSGTGGINISGDNYSLKVGSATVITKSGINLSTTGSGSGGINISGDNYSLNINDTIINKSGIKVDNGGYITVGTGSSSSVQIHSGYIIIDSGYIAGSGWCLKKDEVRFAVPTKINQYLYLPDGGIDVNNNSILISGGGISVKSGAVSITSGGIGIMSGGYLDIGTGYITGIGFRIQSGKISGQIIDIGNSGIISGWGGLYIDGSGYISGHSLNIGNGGISVKSGVIIDSKDIKLNNSSGSIDFNSGAVKINGSGINIGTNEIRGDGLCIGCIGGSGYIVITEGITATNVPSFFGGINVTLGSGSIQFNNTNQKIQGYTGTGTGKTTMSNILIDSSNIINIGSDYTIASSGIPIENTDTLNQALGKLEKRIEDIELAMAASLADLDNRLNEIE